MLVIIFHMKQRILDEEMDISELAFNDVVIVGSCYIDLICFTEKLPTANEYVFGTRFHISYGGKGGNVCVSAAKLGASCALIARVGNDCFGREYVTRMKKLKTDTTKLLVTDDVPSGVAQITVTQNGNIHSVLIPGANNILSIEDIESAKDMFKNAKVGLFTCDIKEDVILAAIKLFIKNGGGKIILLACNKVIKEVYELAHIIIVTTVELGAITGDEVKTVVDAQYSLKKLLKLGCETAIVTLGYHGAIIMGKNYDIPSKVIITPIDNPADMSILFWLAP
ncbi:ribokinase-like isoform X2 [Lycorma delicatula]|uniref:ribokinase-like isoform X2 n=1 Tax=Lycorma delicatula TaxID=130591 RepID=UPI003F5132B0